MAVGNELVDGQATLLRFRSLLENYLVNAFLPFEKGKSGVSLYAESGILVGALSFVYPDVKVVLMAV